MTPPLMSVQEVLRDPEFERAVDQRAQQIARQLLMGSGLRDALEPRGIPRGKIEVEPVLTALPQNPLDGQEVLVSSGVPGFNWRFRYNDDAQSPYRWESIGGPALYDEVAAGEATASIGYVDLTTVGPSITVPFAGEYRVKPTYAGQNTVATALLYMGVKRGAAATVDADAIRAQSPGANYDAVPSRRTIEMNLDAGTVLLAQYRVNAGTGTFGYPHPRGLSVTPVRVGG